MRSKREEKKEGVSRKQRRRGEEERGEKGEGEENRRRGEKREKEQSEPCGCISITCL